MFRNALVAIVFAFTPIVSGAAWAAPVTISDLTVDLPNGFAASPSSRGLLAKSPDGQAFLWVESYLAEEIDTLVADHDKYWERNNVDLGGDPEKTNRDNGGTTVTYLDFAKATWKGDPTVVRYVQYGPYGPEKKMILLTFWGTPKSDTEFGADINKMIDAGVQFHTKE